MVDSSWRFTPEGFVRSPTRLACKTLNPVAASTSLPNLTSAETSAVEQARAATRQDAIFTRRVYTRGSPGRQAWLENPFIACSCGAEFAVSADLGSWYRGGRKSSEHRRWRLWH